MGDYRFSKNPTENNPIQQIDSNPIAVSLYNTQVTMSLQQNINNIVYSNSEFANVDLSIPSSISEVELTPMPKFASKQLYLKPYSWEIKSDPKDENSNVSFHVWCLDRESKPALVRIENFYTSFYIVLPSIITDLRTKKLVENYEWDINKANIYVTWLNKCLKTHQPFYRWFDRHPLIYFYKGDYKYPCIHLKFINENHMRHCINFLKEAREVQEIGIIKVNICEEKIDNAVKLLTEINMTHSQWFTTGTKVPYDQQNNTTGTKVPYDQQNNTTGVKTPSDQQNNTIGVKVPYDQQNNTIGVKTPSDQQNNTTGISFRSMPISPMEDPDLKLSTIENEYTIDWQNIIPIHPDETEKWFTHPKIFSFDIECYSNNHKAFPNKLNPDHVITNISIVVQRANKPETRKRYVLTYGLCGPVKDCEVIICKDEFEILSKFTKIMRDEDPEIITGYNILSFDFSYMHKRLTNNQMWWDHMGRIKGAFPWLKESRWKSGAYGYIHNHILQMEGRIIIDMFPVIKREPEKLLNYDLNTVGKKYVNRGKHPVKPKDMFIAYEKVKNVIEYPVYYYVSQFYGLLGPEGQLDPEKIRNFLANLRQDQAQALNYEIDQAIGRASTPTNDIQRADLAAVPGYNDALKKMTVLTAYCVEDSEIVIDIFEKLNMWSYLCESSNTFGVDITDIYTRGQQIRCISLVYKLAKHWGYIVNWRDGMYKSFTGGKVQDPIIGYHENIPCLDFSSLYPSIIISHNICYTTFLHEDDMDKIPDDKCFVFDFIHQEKPTKKGDDEFLKDDENDDDESEEVYNPVTGTTESVKKGDSRNVHRKYKFVRPEIRKGLLPYLLTDLIAARGKVKKLMAKAKEEKDKFMESIYNQRQLAIKVVANSMYGFLGVARNGRLPLNEAAMCVTAKGRESIMLVANTLIRDYGARIIYGDTDSVMPDLGIKDPKECNRIGRKLAKDLTELLFADLKPMNIEFEKGMNILLFKKKKYLATLLNDEGVANLSPDKILKRGVVIARRDNTMLLRELFVELMMNIFYKKPIEETFYLIHDKCKQLIRGEVTHEKLSIIRELGQAYKSNSYLMALFRDNLKARSKPVLAGDRLEYLVIDIPGEKLMGNRMVLMEEYEEYLSTVAPADRKLKIDYNYYLEKQLKNAIDQIFFVGYMNTKDITKYIGMDFKASKRCRKLQTIATPVALFSKFYKYGEPLESFNGILEKINGVLAPSLQFELTTEPLHFGKMKKKKKTDQIAAKI